MINLVYPELQFSSPGLDRLSELERQGPISQLGLSVRTHNVLRWKHVNTLGELVEILRSEVGIGIVRNFGCKSHEQLVHAVLALSEATTPEGAVDWQQYGELVKKKFCGMRVREAVRYVGLMQTPKLGSKRNDWPRPFGKIPETVSNQLLKTLPFGNRAFQGLKSMGAVTIGDATRICPTDLLKVRNVGRNTIKEIFQTIMAVVAPQAEGPIVQDDPTFASPPFPMVPARSEGIPNKLYRDFFQEIPRAIRMQEGEVDEVILRRRLLCPLGKESTLEETGKKFGITRERIRQIELDLLRMFRTALFEGKYTYERLHPSKGLCYGKVQFRVQSEFQSRCANLKMSVGQGMQPVMQLSDWTARLAKVLGVSLEFVADHTVFWSRILGWKSLQIQTVRNVPSEMLVVSEKVSVKLASRIRVQVETLNRLLLDNPCGLSLEQLQNSKELFGGKTILKNVSEVASLSSVVQVPWAVLLLPKIELVETLTGAYVIETAVKAMTESSRPFKIHEMLQDLKQKFPKLKKLHSHRTIVNLMASDKRFKAIGTTGFWKYIPPTPANVLGG